jgi:hypothetical protein
MCKVEMGAVGMQRAGETSKIFQVVKPLTISWERIPSDISSDSSFWNAWFYKVEIG